MQKPYDATSKELLESDPAGWVAYLTGSAPPGPVRVVDADVSTVTAEADKVIRVDGPDPWVLHLEFQTHAEDWFPPRLLRYNALLHYRHKLSVSTVVFLLRPAANMTSATGSWVVRPPVGPEWEYKYRVIRVWERPPADFLTGALALLPLAPIAATDEASLPEIVDRIGHRLRAEADHPLGAKLWTSTGVLMGLRYENDLIESLLGGTLQMEESTFYRAILARGEATGEAKGEARGEAKGRLAEARAIILRLGQQRLGSAPTIVVATLTAITDLTRLEELSDRLLLVSSWDELLGHA
ncbi:hypothetical protein [Fimbriiglobus ruber]|uniref:DUF4351 domain-containing protein n=1 Tax=Fimbriiglobus ruber TaxID=1908690 RepID=A0A225E2R3_9BACT|nr:hypothetical protein [Fimbriiglobus ruber]OWK45078.1 hypothetical protein FRUB_01409 [Fimbriiglobus ruber]